MHCPNCNQPMAIVGSHWVCGAHDPTVFERVGNSAGADAPQEWLAEVVGEYPYPLACAYRRLQEAVSAHRQDRFALRQLIWVKDCVETLVKYMALIGLNVRRVIWADKHHDTTDDPTVATSDCQARLT